MVDSTSADMMQCKYVYKHCSNPRTYKRDGALHRLCEFHRNKANALQKVYATKRRRELRELRRQVMNHQTSSSTDGFKMEEVTPVKVECYEDSHVKVEDSTSPWFESVASLDSLEWLSDTTTDTLSDEEYAYLSEVF
ncbi:Aste57867_10481 [Aphanomyces stellatus]|uniref:Aste57867_10481 protein n=1 Tax=Aphanomyces stellatus TaxID=120398 RepID=A0A485KQG7_9STRA|nr:hypothetical protein As57867_010441 [Aphanomyces stellatus]VFT87355.1 Aste57867_10481 [Aphanomyces stellatus]